MAKLCKLLEVSRSGYYAWEKRPESSRKKENEELLALMKKLHGKHRGVYGSRKMKKALEQEGWKVNHKRVERLMKAGGLRSRLSVKYKATTNSKHNLPVAENLLNRKFTAAKPGEKMVSDITYIRTNEGWLYAAAVLDLYGQKVIGLSMGEAVPDEGCFVVLGDTLSIFVHNWPSAFPCSAPLRDHLAASALSWGTPSPL